MKILNKIVRGLGDIASIVRSEFITIITSFPIVLVLVGGIFAYGLIYNYLYEPDLIRNAHIAVVDKSQTPLSREYTRLLDAAPQVSVRTNAVGFVQAKELMKRGEVIGVIYIPVDFDTRVGRGEQSLFILYGQTDAFLYYLALQQATSGAMLELDARTRPNMAIFIPEKDIQLVTQAKSINIVGTTLYNHTEGYGSYLIPAVLMVIIFQTLLMVIGMISGDERCYGTIKRFAAKGRSIGGLLQIVLGKTFVYCALYSIFALFLLGLMPVLFSLPRTAVSYEIVMIMIPYLLASSFLGLALSVFYTDSETPLLMIAFFSVGLIFLSGVSYPLELMPWYWQATHYIIPASVGTLAFVKINSMDATMAQISTEYIALWIQSAIYFTLACVAYRHNIAKAMRPIPPLRSRNLSFPPRRVY